MLFKIQLILLSLINLLKLSLSQEPDGVCGFIKNEYKTESLDFALVKVKLITSSGSTKAKTVALPNGYYFLSLEQKGNYTLKVDPPPGWSFEPSSVSINYKGDNLCTGGNDINFHFKGFGITGRLTTVSNNNDEIVYGPSGVKITLYKDKISNDMIVGEKLTDNDGIYFFTPIQPGNYIIKASHDVWKFDKSIYNVIVDKGNTKLPIGSLVLFGFDVSGKVIDEDEQPINDVTLILYGNGKFKDCSIDKLINFNNYLCHVKTNNNGEFIFPSLTNGDYKIIPYYFNKNTKFDVQPNELTFKVNSNSVLLKKNFKITGFTISGEILMSNTSTNKIPVVDAKIYISGKHIATTDKNGYYSIEKMKSGQYTFKIIADNLKFDDKIFKITTNTPIIPIIYPSSYKVCGYVKHSIDNKQTIRSVIVENSMATFHREINTDSNTGEYCLYLKPDKYQFNVVVNHNEKLNGLQFYPLQHTIDVNTMPINNINFSQLKAKINGNIECIDKNLINCMEISITLKIIDGQIIKTIKSINGKYEFNNILPGHYELLIDNDIYCWDNTIQKISITSEHVIVPVFKQIGWSVTFLSSHDTTIEYDNNNNKKIIIPLKSGSTRNCVKKSGEYIFIPKSCHIYSQKSYKWNTNNQIPIILTAIEHRHKGRIVVPIIGTTSENDKQHDIKVNVIAENDNNNNLIPTIVKKVANQGAYRYTFEFNAKPDVTYIITPISDIIIFNHASIKIIGKNDCNDDVATFNGHVGIIISGEIIPPMNDVTVKIFGNNKDVPVHTIITDNTGKYNIGPLNNNINYTVTADKIGYTIIDKLNNGKFIAHKLAEIIINVIDKNTNLSLNGVLLSLSGGNNGNYRKNSITNNNGQLIFNSLSPGNYYLSPMMKEYKFDLTSKKININEGQTINIILYGNRIAFSAYGIVKSLNGEPENGITIEAICYDKNCNVNHEETITDNNGLFRIRGLEPNFNYIIKLKNDVQTNLHIQRSSPINFNVFINNNDTYGIEFIVFHPILRSDVSINIKTNKQEYYRTLKIKLCREDQPDTPIYTSYIDQNSPTSSLKYNNNNNNNNYNNYNSGYLIHLPSLKLDNKKYFLQLESTLSKTLYRYNTIPIYFNTNESFKGINILFNVERNIDQNDMNQSSMLALPLIIIFAIAFLKRDNLFSWFNLIITQLNKNVSVNNKPQVIQVAPIDPRADDIIVEQIMNINKRKVKPRKV